MLAYLKRYFDLDSVLSVDPWEVFNRSKKRRGEFVTLKFITTMMWECGYVLAPEIRLPSCYSGKFHERTHKLMEQLCESRAEFERPTGIGELPRAIFFLSFQPVQPIVQPTVQPTVQPEPVRPAAQPDRPEPVRPIHPYQPGWKPNLVEIFVESVHSYFNLDRHQISINAMKGDTVHYVSTIHLIDGSVLFVHYFPILKHISS